MTFVYTHEVATSTFGCFLRLLRHWRASIYKIIWMDLLIYLMTYYTLNLAYRYLMTDNQKEKFELLVSYCNDSSSLIPVSFVLGFYVSVIMRRWWNQYVTMPWPDSLAVYVSTLVVGQDERGRAMRRTIMRYACLTLTMILCMVAPTVKRRFPTLNHLVNAGIMTQSELDVLQRMDEKQLKLAQPWVPIVWAASVASRARKEGRIREEISLKSIMDELDLFRNGCALILHYDSVSVPLVYTQVVALAVYSYVLGSIFGHQWIENNENSYFNMVDYYFPLFSTLEFFFYMGWLKVAESLMNPFGEDDDDFEVNWLIDRNLQVSYLIVDEMHHEHPVLVKDQYWDNIRTELPYPDYLPGPRSPETTAGKLDIGRDFLVSTESKAQLVNQLRGMPPSVVRMKQSVTQILPTSPSIYDEIKPEVRRPRRSSTLSVEIEGSTSVRNSIRTLSSSATSRVSSIIEQTFEGDNDDFEQLKAERERERQERLKKKVLQNVYVAVSATTGLAGVEVVPARMLPTTVSVAELRERPVEREEEEQTPSATASPPKEEQAEIEGEDSTSKPITSPPEVDESKLEQEDDDKREEDETERGEEDPTSATTDESKREGKDENKLAEKATEREDEEQTPSSTASLQDDIEPKGDEAKIERQDSTSTGVTSLQEVDEKKREQEDDVEETDREEEEPTSSRTTDGKQREREDDTEREDESTAPASSDEKKQERQDNVKREEDDS